MPIAAIWPLPQSPAPSAVSAITGARSEADYLAALQALLPRGRAWSRDPQAVITALVDGWARSYARADARQTNLLTDAFPATTVELLPEWEQTLGLPDPCLGPAPTLQQRQNQVVARILGGGGQSIGYLTAYASSLGFPVAITEFANFRAGINAAGHAVYGYQAPTGSSYFRAGDGDAGDALVMWDGGQPGFNWSFAILVKTIVEPTAFFRAGTGSAGEPIESWYGSAALATISYFSAGANHDDPIASWGAPLLECELRRIAPAQTTLIFAYGA